MSTKDVFSYFCNYIYWISRFINITDPDLLDFNIMHFFTLNINLYSVLLVTKTDLSPSDNLKKNHII